MIRYIKYAVLAGIMGLIISFGSLWHEILGGILMALVVILDALETKGLRS